MSQGGGDGGSSRSSGGKAMGGGGRGKSVVVDTGKSKSTCGYCKSPGDSSVSHGLWAFSMTVDDYQELLDRGWRRCGSYLYKPDMGRTCCPQYTIRLKAEDFVPSKEQVRVLRKMERFLNGNMLIKNADCSKLSVDQDSKSSSMEAVSETQRRKNQEMHEEDNCASYLSGIINAAVEMSVANGELPSAVPLPKAIVKEVRHESKKKLAAIYEDLLYTSNISFQIVATLTRSLTAVVSCENEIGELVKLSPSEVAEKLACSLDVLGITLDVSVKACNGHLNFYSSMQKMSSTQFLSTRDVTEPSSKDVVAAASQRHKIDAGSTMPLTKHILEVRMNRSSFDPEEYALYRKYQITVHNDKPEDVSESSYSRFLVDTPLIFSPPKSGRETPSCGFGSFHQQYLIDGKLIAVGVVDILPKCLSSKYLFWDPDFASLSLGNFSALKEIEWIRQAHGQCHTVQYYYLGYYIHSCSKMRYKANYYPSELQCPLRYRWVPFHIAKPLLDKKPYVVLSDFVKAENRESSTRVFSLDFCADCCGNSEQSIPNNSLSYEGKSKPDDDRETSVVADVIRGITLDFNGSRMRFKDLKKVVGPNQRHVVEDLKLKLHEYEKVVGRKLAGSMIYYYSL